MQPCTLVKLNVLMYTRPSAPRNSLSDILLRLTSDGTGGIQALKLVVLLAALAGLCIAVQATINAAGTRTLGLPVLIAFSGFATGIGGLAFAMLASAKPEFTVRGVAFGIGSGLLGVVILACVTYAVGQGGVARALSLVIAAQLIAGLVLDRLGVFGDGVALSPLKVIGVALIIVGGVFVVRF